MAEHTRSEWHERIEEVEREFAAARTAADDFLAAVGNDPKRLPAETKIRDANAMSDNLEGTYLIRLFAAFESGLRSYWTTTIKKTRAQTEDLINSVATRRNIPDEDRDAGHAVREYRNALVHERDEEPDPVSVKQARGDLQKYFGRLPDEW